MIFDRIDTCIQYTKISRNFTRAFDFLTNTDCRNLIQGKYEIYGNKVFALVQDYYTQPQDKLAWEAHRKYIDLQYIVKGTELIGYNHISQMKPITDYLPLEDYLLFEGEGEYFTISEGFFAVFFPHDCHKVRIQAGSNSYQVKKVVVKVSI